MYTPGIRAGHAVDAFRLIAEQRIQEAIDRGEFDDLPHGKRIRFFENPFLPPELRVAYKLLQDAGIRPREVELMREAGELGRELEEAEEPGEAARISARLGEVQAELDLLLGKAVPYGASRRRRRRGPFG